MYIPTLTTILGGLFLCNIAHSIYQMALLFTSVKCSDKPCYKTFLATKPSMQLVLFLSTKQEPLSHEVETIFEKNNFDYMHEFETDLTIDIPLRTRRNGTLYLHMAFAKEGEAADWRTLRREGPNVVHAISITEYMVPRVETFNLLGDKSETNTGNLAPKKVVKSNASPVTHIRSKVYVSLLTDDFSVSQRDVPPEMVHLIHANRYKQILPIIKTDFFNTRIKDLVEVTKNTTEFKFTYHYQPMGIGRLRLMLLIEHAMNVMLTMGFVVKDVDEVKGIFSGTNVYLLCCTLLVASIHILFDFLSFKNDVIFWREKKSYEGLSMRTTLWRAISQIVIFLYLLDEQTTLIILIPAGLGTLIELWKCKKILRIEMRYQTLLCFNKTYKANESIGDIVNRDADNDECRTEEFDKQGMRYLSYLLYPLCIGGAIYSLLYQPHRGWYSWTLHSLVNGVYAFGFLFMLPQLFVNYKLKSVAALPWRAFMYKAFNTFIDDFFAFIISMPTAHRVACLRDDVVFLIYLYQRWLYPVDKTRNDLGLAIETKTKQIDKETENQTEPKLPATQLTKTKHDKKRD